MNTPQLPVPSAKVEPRVGSNQSATEEEATVAEVEASAMEVEATAMEETAVMEEQATAIEDWTRAALAASDALAAQDARDAARDALADKIVNGGGQPRTDWTDGDQVLLDDVQRQLQQALDRTPPLSLLPAPTEEVEAAAAHAAVKAQWGGQILPQLADSGDEATATTTGERKRRIGEADGGGEAGAAGDHAKGKRMAKKRSANQVAMTRKPNESTVLLLPSTRGTKSLVSLAHEPGPVPTTRPRTKRSHPEHSRAVVTPPTPADVVTLPTPADVVTPPTPADEQPASLATPGMPTHIMQTVGPPVMLQTVASSTMATGPSSTQTPEQQLAERLQFVAAGYQMLMQQRRQHSSQQRPGAGLAVQPPSSGDSGSVRYTPSTVATSAVELLLAEAKRNRMTMGLTPETTETTAGGASTVTRPTPLRPPPRPLLIQTPAGQSGATMGGSATGASTADDVDTRVTAASDAAPVQPPESNATLHVAVAATETTETTIQPSVERKAATAPVASPKPVAGKRVRVRSSGKSREKLEAEREEQRREALEGPWPTPLQPAEASPYAYASEGRRSTGAHRGLTAVSGHDVRLNRMEPALESLVRGSKVTEAKWAAVGAAVTPAALVRTRGTEFFRTFGAQGAIKVRVEGVWDHDAQASRLMNLSWLTQCQLKLRTLGRDYQYVRQALPSVTGDIAVFENVVGEESLNLDYPFGALLEDIYVEFAAAAGSCRLMGPSQREAFFHQQIHMGFPSQFLYLQGVALDALGGTSARVSARQRAQPAEAHAWEPQALVDAAGSVLVTALDACERLCAPKILATLGRGGVVRSGMAAAVGAGESASAAAGAEAEDGMSSPAAVMGSPEAVAVAVKPATPAKRPTPRKRKPPATPPAPPVTQAVAAAEAERSAAGGTMVRAERVLLTNRKARAAEGITLNLQRTANGRIKHPSGGRSSKGKFASAAQALLLQRTAVAEGDGEQAEGDWPPKAKAVSANNAKKRNKPPANPALCEIERQRAILTQGAKQASGSGVGNEGSSSKGNSNGAAAVGLADWSTPKRKAKPKGEEASSPNPNPIPDIYAVL